jgi:hypothetical protein
MVKMACSMRYEKTAVNFIFIPMVPPPADDVKYIVRAPWGDILQISWDDEYVRDRDVRTSSVAYTLIFSMKMKFSLLRSVYGSLLLLLKVCSKIVHLFDMFFVVARSVKTSQIQVVKTLRMNYSVSKPMLVVIVP